MSRPLRWYRFHAPDKQRPVVILTRDSAIEYLGDVTVAPITSTVREIPTEVMLGPGDSMPRECAVNLDHVRTVARVRIGARITTLSARGLLEIRTALPFALGYS